MSKSQEMLIARRYARALLSLADSKKKLTDLTSGISTLESLLTESVAFNSFLKNPLIKKSERIQAVLHIAKKVKLNKNLQNFLGVLAQNKRLALLPVILKTLKLEIAKHCGELSADIISASALSKTQVKAVKQALEKAVGRDVDVNTQIDKSIIGGLVIKVGSLQIDHSVKTRLSRLDRVLRSSDVTAMSEPVKEVA